MRVVVIAVGRSGEEARKQIEISPTDTVDELYRRVAKALDRSPRDFNLTYDENPLTDKNQKVATLGIKEGDTVYASIVAEGGGLKKTIMRITSSLSPLSFSEDEIPPVGVPSDQSIHETPPLEPESTQPSLEMLWLNVEYGNMQRHQPAATVKSLREHFFDFQVPEGIFQKYVFSLYMVVGSPFEPPKIYCYDSHGHPNFYRDGLLCVRTAWSPFGSLWEYLERVKTVIANPNYRSPAK